MDNTAAIADDDDDDDVTAFFAQMLDAAAPVAGAAAGDASAVRQDGAERIIAFALEAWNHNSLALALLHTATTPEELFHTGDWKADLVEVLVLAGWRGERSEQRETSVLASLANPHESPQKIKPRGGSAGVASGPDKAPAEGSSLSSCPVEPRQQPRAGRRLVLRSTRRLTSALLNLLLRAR